MHAAFTVHIILKDKILEVPNKRASDKLLMKGYRILHTVQKHVSLALSTVGYKPT